MVESENGTARTPRRRRARPTRRITGPTVWVDPQSGAGRYYRRMLREIETDLGGEEVDLSRIERELIAAFCGAATATRYMTGQVMIGDISELDLTGFSQLASVCLRIGSKLGLRRRMKDVIEPPGLGDILIL